MSGRLGGRRGRCRLGRVLLGCGPCRLIVSSITSVRRGDSRSGRLLDPSFVGMQGINLGRRLGRHGRDLRKLHGVGTKGMVARRKDILRAGRAARRGLIRTWGRGLRPDHRCLSNILDQGVLARGWQVPLNGVRGCRRGGY